MNEAAVLAARIGAELTNGLEEGKRFDVAYRATDLDENNITILASISDRLLDGIGHVRDDLNGPSQIIAASLRCEHLVVDSPGGHVVDLAEGRRRKPFVVPEIEIRFGTVFGHVDLAVLKRIHCPGIDVQVGIELEERHLQASGLEQRADRRGGESLAER